MRVSSLLLLTAGCATAERPSPAEIPTPPSTNGVSSPSASVVSVADAALATPAPATDAGNSAPEPTAEEQSAMDQAAIPGFTDSMRTWLEPYLSTVKRGPPVRGLLSLVFGSTLADVARTFKVGEHRCEGVYVVPLCPTRTFVAALVPLVDADRALKLRGRFFDGKLAGVYAEIAARPRTYTLAMTEEDRVEPVAFEAAVVHLLGKPTTLAHFPSTWVRGDPWPPIQTILEYGHSLTVVYSRGDGARVIADRASPVEVALKQKADSTFGIAR